MPTTVTSTIRSSGGTYTSLSAWFAVKQGNIVTADQVQVAECYDDWATGLDDAVTITGATTDSTRYYKITVASGNRHTGIPQTGFFIKRAHTGSGIIRLDQNYTEVEWLDVEQTSTGDDYKAFITVAGKTGIKITNCLAKSVANAAGASFYIPDATAICCLAYESTRTGFGLNAGSSTYNCTSAECRFGFSADSTAPIIKNCVSYNSSYSNYFNVTGTNCDYNATSTGSDDAPGANSVISVASGDFVNAASNDFHLASGSALIGAGTNLYSTFTTDIDGDTWPSSGAWDIGFDYRVAGGGGATLTADSGTYALTGTAATLKADRKLAADSGSYAITGTDVSLKLGRKLTAESGTYTVNGTAVSLTVGRKLTADSGTYSLTGTDVTLTYSPAGGYTLALDSGSYTLTGTAATLKVARTLAADSGTYALTGTDVTLTRGFRITADSGTYTLTGSNVAFARTYCLPADSGTYTLSGSPVSLSWSGEVIPEAPTHGGPSIYGKAVFREAEFKREYEREVSRIENERIRAIQMREDEEIVIIMAALAA